MKKIFGLTKILLALRPFSYYRQNSKEFFKAIGFVVLILFSLSGLFTMNVLFSKTLFFALKPLKLESTVLALGAVNTVLIILALGVIAVLSGYYYDGAEYLLALPFKGRELLGAKILVNYFYHLPIAVLFFGIPAGVYGYFGGEGIFYWIFAILNLFLLPVLPLSLIFAFFVLIFRSFSFAGKKDLLMYLGGVIGLGAAILIQKFSSTMQVLENNPRGVLEKFADPNLINLKLYHIYLPALLTVKALTAKALVSGLFYLGINILLSLGLAVIGVYLLGKAYERSLKVGAEGVSSRKKSRGELVFSERKVFMANLLREIKLVNREPVYFLNGPLVIFIIPLIFGITYYFQGQAGLPEINKIFAQKNFEQYLLAGSISLGIFLSAATNIPATAISREAKELYYLKSLPVAVNTWLLGKIAHGYVFAVIASLLVGIIALGLKLSFGKSLLILPVVILAVLPIFAAGLLIDLKRPYLNWDHPQKAFKQNLNSLVGVFLPFVQIGLYWLFLLKFKVEFWLCTFGFTGSSFLLGLLLLYYTLKEGEKSFTELEV